MSFESRSLLPGLLSLACVVVLACDPAKEKTTANPEPSGPSATPPPSASASTAAKTAMMPEAPPPLLEPAEQFSVPEGYSGVYAVDGAILVSSESRYGKLGDSGVEWKLTLSPHPAYGPVMITAISGAFPDAVDLFTMNSNGRAPSPTYMAATGKGSTIMFSGGGGLGWISGIARIGESTLIEGYDNTQGGHRIETVRGPALTRSLTTRKAGGCTSEDLPIGSPDNVALDIFDFGATSAGTLIAVGELCKDKGPAAEIWPPGSTKSTIVKLDKPAKSVGNDFLRGPGDTAWLVNDELTQILELRDGKLAFLPALPSNKKIGIAFVGDDGALFASDETVIYRLDGGAWKEAATLVWPTSFSHLLFRDGTYWGVSARRLVKLAPGKSVSYAEGCKTPFVHLYDVSYKAEPTYKFPTTTKALSTFADVEKVGLVEYFEGRRRLGITVPSKEVGDAIIAHVKATMKDEDPKLLCYEPKTPRAIPVTKAK